MSKDLKTRIEQLEQRAETDQRPHVEIWHIEGDIARGPDGQVITVSEYEALPADQPRMAVEVIKTYE